MVSYARRDTGEKGTFLRKSAGEDVKPFCSRSQKEMRDRARQRMRSSIATIPIARLISGKVAAFRLVRRGGVRKKIEETANIKILGSPYEKEEYHGKCLACGRETDTVVYAARAM